MREMEENSIDTIITDPPYGLKFMGKKWDYDVPSKETFEEMLRVIKPGGTMLCFAGTRTQHRMAVNIEDAGWILKDVLMWIFGSGFPKATDISKQLDKKVLINDLFKPFAKHYEKKRKRKELTHNQICEKGKFYDKVNHGGASSNWSLGLNVPTLKQWQVLKELLDLSDEFLPLIERVEAEREVIGKQKNAMSGWNTDGSTKFEDRDITLSETPEAKLWNGWKSHGLKPAYEPIIVAMKPNEGTYANNALKHGVSGLNIDGGRIKHNEPIKIMKAQKDGNLVYKQAGRREETTELKPEGRYPANIILDEEAAKILDEQSGELKSGSHKSGQPRNAQSKTSYIMPNITTFTDKGSKGGASRFFKVIK